MILAQTEISIWTIIFGGLALLALGGGGTFLFLKKKSTPDNRDIYKRVEREQEEQIERNNSVIKKIKEILRL